MDCCGSLTSLLFMHILLFYECMWGVWCVHSSHSPQGNKGRRQARKRVEIADQERHNGNIAPTFFLVWKVFFLSSLDFKASPWVIGAICGSRMWRLRIAPAGLPSGVRFFSRCVLRPVPMCAVCGTSTDFKFDRLMCCARDSSGAPRDRSTDREKR